MKIKLEITDVLIHKFSILMGNQLNRKISKVDIEDLGNQYQFRFEEQFGGGWHFELDKFDKNSGMFTLKCSTRMLEVPLNHIRDLKMFCAKTVQLKEMQTEYVNNK